MLDPSESGSDMPSKSPEVDKPEKKTCADCGTTKTPLWRGGPAGPKSLCNACGIRSRKKRRDMLGLKTNDKKSRKGHSGASRGSGSNHGKLGEGLNQRLMALGMGVVTPRSRVEKQRRKLGEVEQAAALLMALSYGSVYG